MTGTNRGEGKILRIAISGKSGCGNTSAGKRTAEILGLKFINYTFRNLAEERGVSFEEAVTLAQTDSSWDRAIDSRQVELASEGGGGVRAFQPPCDMDVERGCCQGLS